MDASHAVPVLRVADAEAAIRWYARLGFAEDFRHRFGPGMPLYVGVLRPDGGRVHLSEHRGDARPNTLVYLVVPDFDAMVEACAPDHVHDNTWGRDFEVKDLDGNRIRVGSGPSES